MKDFLGRELDIGDKVVVTPKNYRGLIIAEIIKFTASNVRLSYMNTWNYAKPGYPEEYLVPPYSVVKVIG